jgi:transcription factor C subunit 7
VPELYQHFPNIIPNPSTNPENNIHVIPSTRGETIPQLHNRVATTLAAIIADADADIRAEEEQENRKPSSKAILICSHAATLIAMGRALTGNMPDDPNEEDFHVYTAGLSTYVRRRKTQQDEYYTEEEGSSLIAAGTKLLPESEVRVPVWKGGKGVGGGWDCVANCDCSFLSGGEERGW